jgi:flagellin
MERLSSGLRINRAADDAAGLAVSEEMRTQIRGMDVASRNALDGVSMVQVADGALAGVGDMLQRIRDLAVQASNGTLTDQQRSNLDAEVQSILAEVGRVASDTDFNGIKILSGSVAMSPVTLQIGANAGETIAFTVATMTASDLGISGLAVSSQASASAAIASIDAAIKTVTSARAQMGAIQNRLEQTISRLDLTQENLQAAESRIRDADMASEMIDYTRNQILQQSGTAMLAQANQAPQSILQLLNG